MTRLTPIDKRLSEVMVESYRKNFSLQSDFFRANAPYVAMAASLGYLTTRVYGDVYSSEWRPTSKGLRWLEKTFGKNAQVDLDVPEDMT